MKTTRLCSILLTAAFVMISLTACQPAKTDQASPAAQTVTTTAAAENDLFNMKSYENDEVFDFKGQSGRKI